MADYNPPIEDLPIFDSSLFLTGDKSITQNEADKRYLRYPNAQGTENLKTIVVNGTSTFNALSIFNAPIQMNAINETDRLLTTHQINFKTGDSTSTCNLTLTGADMMYDNNRLSGTHKFIVEDNAGFGLTALILASTNVTISPPLVLTSAVCPMSSAIQPATNDNSNKIPTTAWVQSVISSNTPSVYTLKYTDNATFNLPLNTISVDIMAIGAGGYSGDAYGNGTTYYSGGSGAGGQLGYSCNRIPMLGGVSLTVEVQKQSATGYYQLSLTGGDKIIKVYNGGAGRDATSSSAGAGGPTTTTNPITNTNFSTWQVNLGTVGATGGFGNYGNTSGLPTTAGYPYTRYQFTEGTDGCGQRYNGSSNTGLSSTTRGYGAIYITCYTY